MKRFNEKQITIIKQARMILAARYDSDPENFPEWKHVPEFACHAIDAASLGEDATDKEFKEISEFITLGLVSRVMPNFTFTGWFIDEVPKDLRYPSIGQFDEEEMINLGRLCWLDRIVYLNQLGML
ncbi:hypothetical protein CPT_Maja_096 [Burkholderia phage Maja]|uniref:Uncharacterized protein n=1 Tax=Burkholderia phage Maja TaxID=2767571 RepID=A0A7S6U379_9CAUD|nr:hypothetical protein CPT_Maja_096 [Burkholderia phage Maja]